MNGVADLGTLVVRMTADNGGFDVSMLKSVARIAGVAAAVASVTTAAVAFGATTTRAFADFEQRIVKSLAIMSEEDKAFRGQMEATALALATKSVSSAEELAGAYYYLASAGLDAQRSMKALGVTQRLAVAGDMQLERATETLTDSIANLGLASKDTEQYARNMQRVSDVLVKAGADSNASTEQLAVSLRTKAGASLRMFNKDVEEGVAVLMAFGNQGVKAENAGESLNIVIRDLARANLLNRQAWKDFGVDVFDAAGNMRNLGLIMKDMEDRMGLMTDSGKKSALMMLGFQDRTVSATNALIGMSGQIIQFEADLRKAGGFTDRVANEQLDNLNSQLTILKNTLNVLWIRIGREITPAVRALTETFAKWARTAEETTGGATSFGVIMREVFVAVMKTGVWAVQGLRIAWNGFVVSMTSIFQVLAMAATKLNPLSAFANVMTFFESIPQHFKKWWAEAVLSAKDSINLIGIALSELFSFFGTKREFKLLDTSEEITRIRGLDAEISGIRKKHEDMLNELTGGFFGSMELFLTAFSGQAAKMRDDAVKSIPEIWRQTNTFLEEFERRLSTQVRRSEDLKNAMSAVRSSAVAAADASWGLGKAMAYINSFNERRKAVALFVTPEALNNEQVKGMLSATDAYDAQRATVQLLSAALEAARARQKELNIIQQAGQGDSTAYAAAVEQNNTALRQLSVAMDEMKLKGDLSQPFEATIATLKRYDVQLESSVRRRREYDTQFANGVIDLAEYNRLVRQGVIEMDAYERKRAEALHANNPFVGENILRAGYDGTAGVGQPGWDASMVNPTGIADVDTANQLAAQEQLLTDSYERQVAALKEMEAQKTLTQQQANQVRVTMQRNYAAQMERLEQQRTEMILGSAQSIGESLTSIAADTAGQQSGFYKTMFAMSKAFAIADASVKIAQGIAAAAANPWPANLAAMASVAAATASIVSNIMAVRMTSFEGGGLTPTGARSGGVDGRGGMLSVLHPNEMVVDLESPANRGNQAAFGGGVTVNVINNAGVSVETESSEDGKNITVLIERIRKQVASDIVTGRGDIPRAIQQSYALGRGRA